MHIKLYLGCCIIVSVLNVNLLFYIISLQLNSLFSYGELYFIFTYLIYFQCKKA